MSYAVERKLFESKSEYPQIPYWPKMSIIGISWLQINSPVKRSKTKLIQKVITKRLFLI